MGGYIRVEDIARKAEEVMNSRPIYTPEALLERLGFEVIYNSKERRYIVIYNKEE